MTTIGLDVRYALRLLWRARGFTAVAVITLALGIGANAAIFSIVYAALLKPLPYESADRLVMLWSNPNPERGRGGAASPADFLDWRTQNTSFEGLSAIDREHMTLTGTSEASRVPGVSVSANFFELMRARPALGRTFSAEDDRFGAPRVVVLGHGFWQERFGGDPKVLGRTLAFDSRPYTVIGVMPAGFDFPREVFGAVVNYWVPFQIDPADVSRGAHFFAVFGRLHDGVSLATAQAEMDTISLRLQQQYPDTNTNWMVNLFTLQDEVAGDTRTALLTLLGAVGFVLFIACANVANLLLARATSRSKELAVRAALGASRWRLLRQLLAESVVLSLLGALVGIFLAAWGLELAASMMQAWVPRAWEITLSLPVLAFTAVVAVVTGIVFGLAPGVHVSRAALNDSLKRTGRGSVSSGHQRLRTVFVVSEVALAFVLLIGAGLLMRSFHQLQNVRAGFEPERTMTAVLSLPESRYEALAHQTAFTTPLLERVRRVPDVRHAALGSSIPFDRKETLLTFSVAGEPEPPPSERRLAQFRVVSDGFFETMGIAAKRGRAFTAADVEGAPQVAVVSSSLAAKFFPNGDPIGQRVTLDEPEDETRSWFTIVGVVDDVRYRRLDEAPRPMLYYPVAQLAFPELTLVAKTGGDPRAITTALRGIVRSLDPQMALADVRTMDEVVSASLAGARFRTTLLGVFALVALLLSAIGVYGVMSYAVEQRTQEMGLRMALGATGADVLRLVAGQGMRLAVAGILVGLVAAYWVVRVLESLLFGISASDPATFAAIAVLLAAVAALASYVPARRATKADPMLVLRAE
jgi:putative ABC transport system permease protein